MWEGILTPAFSKQRWKSPSSTNVSHFILTGEKSQWNSENLVGQAAPFPLTLYSLLHSSLPCWELFLKTVSDKTTNLGGWTRLSQTAAIRHSWFRYKYSEIETGNTGLRPFAVRLSRIFFLFWRWKVSALPFQFERHRLHWCWQSFSSFSLMPELKVDFQLKNPQWQTCETLTQVLFSQRRQFNVLVRLSVTDSTDLL